MKGDFFADFPTEGKYYSLYLEKYINAVYNLGLDVILC